MKKPLQTITLLAVGSILLVWVVILMTCGQKPDVGLHKARARITKLQNEIFVISPAADVKTRERAVREYVGILRRSGKAITLRHADLKHMDLREADLSFADLVGADLSSAILVGADLRKAKLGDCDKSCFDSGSGGGDCTKLKNADLEKAILDHATVCGADVRGAKLTTARVTQGQVNAMTGDYQTKISSKLERPASWEEYNPE